ncbi:MAG: ABC transporter permease, partial [Terriglobales bacterium]
MGRKREREMEKEFAFHAEREALERQAEGEEPAGTRRRAALTLGATEHWKEEARNRRRGAAATALALWGRDLRLALRGLWRSPGFAAAAVLTLGLGIGANTAVFSVVEAVLLRPLPFAQPTRLNYLWETYTRRPGSQITLSYPDFLDLRTAPGFAGMAAFAVSDLPLTGVGPAAHVRAAAVSSNLFELLGVAPAVGRGFRLGEDAPGSLAGRDAVVLSDALARAKFGTPATALDRNLTLDGRPYTVVGVMPSGFQFPLDNHEALWTTVAPLQVSTNGPPMTAQRGAHWMRGVVRLAGGVSPAAAGVQLETISRRLALQHPAEDKYLGTRLVPMLANYTAATQPILLVLFGAVGCVLLIACVNVAGLMLARAVRRRGEFALRAALGASRGAVLRQLACESLAVGLLGAGAGLALAEIGIRGLVRLGPADIVRLDQTHLSPPVLLFALGLGVATALLFGLFPALELLRCDRSGQLRDAMAAGGRGGLGAGGPRGWRRGLVAAQFALALAVLAGALLMIHSLGRLLNVAPGFSPNGVLTATINIPDAHYPQPGDDAQFFDRLVARLRAWPGVAAAAAAMPAPLGGSHIGVGFDLPDHPLPMQEQPDADVSVVTPGFFAALAIPLLRGRDFSDQDRHGSPEVAIVNQAFARQFLAGRDPLGVRITPGISSYSSPDPVRTIIGIVADTRQSTLSAPDPPLLYIPQDQVPFDGLQLVVRTRPGAEAMAAAAARAVVHGLDPDVPVYNLRPMSAWVAASLAPARFNALLLTIFAGLALLLAAVGLYAVMAQAVAQRRREIGIRVALGAGRGEITGMVVREGMVMAGLGIGAGLLAAWGLGRALASTLAASLYATSALDPIAFAAAPLLLAAIAWAACA